MSVARFGAKPLLKPMLIMNDFCRSFEAHLRIVAQENAFENVVCKMVAFLFDPQCVKWYCIRITYVFQKMVCLLLKLDSSERNSHHS